MPRTQPKPTVRSCFACVALVSRQKVSTFTTPAIDSTCSVHAVKAWGSMSSSSVQECKIKILAWVVFIQNFAQSDWILFLNTKKIKTNMLGNCRFSVFNLEYKSSE